jgi:hypothetical protein
LVLDPAQLLDPRMVLGARDRQHHERAARGREAERIERHARARLGESLEVRGEGVPVRELPVGSDLEAEVLARRWDRLGSQRRRDDREGREGHRQPS